MIREAQNGSDFMEAVEMARKVSEQKRRQAQATNAIDRARKAAREREGFVPKLPATPRPLIIRF